MVLKFLSFIVILSCAGEEISRRNAIKAITEANDNEQIATYDPGDGSEPVEINITSCNSMFGSDIMSAYACLVQVVDDVGDAELTIGQKAMIDYCNESSGQYADIGACVQNVYLALHDFHSKSNSGYPWKVPDYMKPASGLALLSTIPESTVTTTTSPSSTTGSPSTTSSPSETTEVTVTTTPSDTTDVTMTTMGGSSTTQITATTLGGSSTTGVTATTSVSNSTDGASDTTASASDTTAAPTTTLQARADSLSSDTDSGSSDNSDSENPTLASSTDSPAAIAHAANEQTQLSCFSEAKPDTTRRVNLFLKVEPNIEYTGKRIFDTWKENLKASICPTNAVLEVSELMFFQEPYHEFKVGSLTSDVVSADGFEIRPGLLQGEGPTWIFYSSDYYVYSEPNVRTNQPNEGSSSTTQNIEAQDYTVRCICGG